MFSFCVDKRVLGTDKHLLYDRSSISWSTDVPAAVFHLSGEIKKTDDWCLDSLLKLAGVSVNVLPPNNYLSAWHVVSGNRSLARTHAPEPVIPWQYLMPAAAHRAFCQAIVESVIGNLNKLPTSYFERSWRAGNSLLRSLQPAKINGERYERLIESRVGNVSSVESFKPDQDGYAQHVQYDRFGTLTGRLTVSSGPRILTLKREHREIIAPSTADGKIVSLDFAALEARVLLYEAGRRCEERDLYAAIARDLGSGVTRKAVKGAVISELYGSSKHVLGRALGISGKTLDDFVNKIRAYFNTGALLKRLRVEFLSSGKISNRYGRPVTIDEPLDNVIINYYAQSSGADVALMGFTNVLDQLRQENVSVRPLFVLHDGLFLDVPTEHVDRVMSIDNVHVDGYVQKFALKAELMNTVTA